MSKKKPEEQQEFGAVPTEVAREVSIEIPVGPETKSVAEWAEAKGLLPAVLRVDEGGFIHRNPVNWKFAAVKAFKRWDDAQQVTEAEFDTAVETAANQPL